MKRKCGSACCIAQTLLTQLSPGLPSALNTQRQTACLPPAYHAHPQALLSSVTQGLWLVSPWVKVMTDGTWPQFRATKSCAGHLHNPVCDLLLSIAIGCRRWGTSLAPFSFLCTVSQKQHFYISSEKGKRKLGPSGSFQWKVEATRLSQVSPKWSKTT